MLNTIVLIGRLTRDPELRYTGQGTAVANFGIAVDRGFKSNSPDGQTADFFNVVCWSRLAETVAEYMTKGRLVAVQGRLQSRSYESNGQRRTSIEIVANTVRFLDRGNQNQNQYDNQNQQEDAPFRQQSRPAPRNQYPNQNYNKAMNFDNDEDDDLPF